MESEGKPKFKSVYLIWVIIAIAVLALLGWQFNITLFKGPLVGLVPINPTSAITFLLLSGSFLLLSSKKASDRARKAGYFFADLGLLIGAAVVLASFIGLDATIDRILFAKKLQMAGNTFARIGPNTAFGFLLAGLSLLFLHTETRKKKLPTQWLATLLGFIGLFSFLGYLYQVPEFYTALAYYPISFQSSICFILFSLAILFTTNGKGVMANFGGPLIGSVTARKIIPVAIIVPVSLGFLRLLGQWYGTMSTELGVTILVGSITAIFVYLIWHNAEIQGSI